MSSLTQAHVTMVKTIIASFPGGVKARTIARSLCKKLDLASNAINKSAINQPNPTTKWPGLYQLAKADKALTCDSGVWRYGPEPAPECLKRARPDDLAPTQQPRKVGPAPEAAAAAAALLGLTAPAVKTEPIDLVSKFDMQSLRF